MTQENVNDREEELLEDEVQPIEEGAKVKLLRSILLTSYRPRIEVPMYDGNLNVEELINQINALDNYFEYGNIEEDKILRFDVTKLKGHASIW